MKKGRWFLKFWVNITGENSVGSEVDIDEEISIPLYATDKEDAERRVQTVADIIKAAAEEEDKIYFRQYCDGIDDEDRLTFSNFRLVGIGPGEKFEKKLDIHVPCIIGGS